MANRAFDGTRIGSLEDRSGDPEAPYFRYLARFQGLQSREGFKVSVALISHSTFPTHVMHGLRFSYKISSEIKAGAKWKTVYLLFKDDKRYTNALGSPGSGPLELL